MDYNKKTPLYIVTSRTGYIPQLQQSGPIPNPIRVPAEVVCNMIASGIDVHEVDPVTRKVVRLTIENLYDSNKFAPTYPPAPVAGPEEIPTPLQSEAVHSYGTDYHAPQQETPADFYQARTVYSAPVEEIVQPLRADGPQIIEVQPTEIETIERSLSSYVNQPVVEEEAPVGEVTNVTEAPVEEETTKEEGDAPKAAAPKSNGNGNKKKKK